MTTKTDATDPMAYTRNAQAKADAKALGYEQTADPKHIPTSFSEWLEQNNDDIGGNWIPDRVESNEDQYQ